VIELWQTEWCPSSRRVRERLTELGVDYVIHQVPVEKELRDELRAVTGADSIPAAVCADGRVVVGEEAIVAALEARFPDPPGAESHRAKAAKARRRYLEEECECLPPVTR
jgi:glutathione S-transferase